MKIKILNKNRINPTGSYNLSNIQSYEIDEGFVYTQNYNETLDSANIRISNLPSEIEISPFDEVMLFGDSRFGNIYLCVDTYTETHNSFGNDKTYNYDISLFSQTKLLETILLPNLSITPLKENKRSVAFYLSQYLDEYCYKIRYGIATPNERAKRFLFKSRVLERFDNVICPEMQWNTPTLREVFTDLMMVDDCIPVVSNGLIDYIDLTETKKEITNYNYITKSQSSSDYVSEIKMNLQNVLQTNKDKVRNTTTISEYIPFTSDEWVLTSENVVLKTEYPILRVNKLEICFINADGRDIKYKKVVKDITSYVKETKDYQSLRVLDRWISDYSLSDNNYTKYQNYCLHFTRGGNVISGWSNKTKYSSLLTYSTIQMISNLAEYQYHQSNAYNTEYYSYLFKIEYETTTNQVLSVGKSDLQDNYRQIQDNQTNAWVDIYNQGNLEYQKANRLGNKQIMINQRIENNSQDLIKIGDKLGNNIIYQTQYQVYDLHIEVNANACENYVLKNYFTGINSKIRTWRNATDEAFKKELLIKYYCEFDYQPHTEFSLSGNIPAKTLLLDTDTNRQEHKIKQALIRVDEEPENAYYLLACNSRVSGDSMIFTTGLSTNSYIANHYDLEIDDLEVGGGLSYNIVKIKSDKLQETGGVSLTPYNYVDENYEAFDYDIYLINDILDPKNIVDGGNANEANFKQYYLNRFLMPKVSEEVITPYYTYESYGTISNLKDNKEIPTFTFQYEFCTANRDIYFTRNWVEIQNLVATQNTTVNTLKVYSSNTYNYKAILRPIDAQLRQSSIITLENVNNGVCGLKISNTSGLSVGQVIYICDSSDNVLLAFKVKEQKATQTLYLNILYDRNKNIYYKDSVGNNIKGGTI